ncbi:hypothetical protein HS125_07675 [bacterium]|nr:hypothetical protein [bacterium]
MLSRILRLLDRPRLAFALLVLAALACFAGAYAGRVYVDLGVFELRSSRGWRLVAFFLLSLTYWAMTTRMWDMSDRRARPTLLILYLLSAVCLFAPEIGSDGSSYYAQLRSLVLDRDLNFYNEIAGHPEMWAESELDSLHERGYTYVGFPIGPAIFWLPFFLAGHVHAHVLSALGERVLLDGYSWPYPWWTLSGTVLFGFAGMMLTYRLLRRTSTPGAALWGTLFCALGTPLLSYLFVEPSFSHALSFMLGAGFLLYWSEHFDAPTSELTAGWRPYLTLGWLLGLSMVVRWQNVLFAALPALDALRLLRRHAQQRRPGDAVRTLARYAALAAVAFLAFLPQMLVWKLLSGSLFIIPQGEGYLDWTQWNTWRVLLHPQHGLFSMHPLALVGLLGLALGWRRHPRLCVYLGIAFLLQLAISSVVHDWWAGGAFGQRRLDSVFPILGLGLAWMLERWSAVSPPTPLVKGGGDGVRYVGPRLGFLFLLLLLLWNFMLLAEYRIGPLGSLGALDWTVISSPFGELGWKKLADFVVYRPMFRALWGGVFHADGALLLSGLVPALLLALGCAFVLARLRLWWTWPRRLELRLSFFLVAAVVGLLVLALRGAETRSVLNLRPAQHLGNLTDLTVHRAHGYEGGFARLSLCPGERRQMQFTRRAVADRLELVAYLSEPAFEHGSDVALRLELLTEDGQALPLDFRCPHDLDRLDAERFLSRPWELARTADVARSWRPSPNAQIVWHSYRATRRLGAPTRLVGLTATNLLAEGTVHVEGIAFNHAEDGSGQRTPPARFLPIPLAPIANADYKHNPFVPHGAYDPHYGLVEGLLFWNDEPFAIPKSVHDGGGWSIFTTCSRQRQDAELALPAQPLSRLDLLVCGGLIRKREVFDLVEVSAQYVDGATEGRVLAANRDVFDYLDPYAPRRRLVFGQARAYQYDGPLYVVSLPLSRPGVAVDRLRWSDLRGERSEGVTFFALTAVRSAPVGSPAALLSDGSVFRDGVVLRGPDADPSRRAVDLAASPEGRGFHVLFSDGSVEGVETRERLHGRPLLEARKLEPVAGGGVVMDASGRLHAFGNVRAPDGVALGEGMAADFVLTPQGDGAFVLDRYGAVHCAGRTSPLGPGPYFSEPIAVDLEWGYERYGLYILDRTGAVSRIGSAPYYGRAFMREGEEARSLTVFPDGYVITTSLGRILSLGGAPEFIQAAGATLDAAWTLR